MGEWHEHLTRPKPLLTNVVLHDGVAARETVLVPEAVEDALRSVPLLAVAGPIVFQDPIDDSRERTQLWPPRRRASAIPWRHRERQHLTDRLAVYTKHPRGLAGAHPLDMTRPPNPCVQLHPIHPPRLPVRATLTEGYTRSHFGPPQPDRPAASVGDYCSAVLKPVMRTCWIVPLLVAAMALGACSATQQTAPVTAAVTVHDHGPTRPTRDASRKAMRSANALLVYHLRNVAGTPVASEDKAFLRQAELSANTAGDGDIIR